MRLSLAITAAVVLATLAPATSMAQSMPDAVLAVHNTERAMVGSAPLAWDADLAAGAQVWADHLAETGQFAHSDTPKGENLWMGSAGAYSYASMAQTWADEKSQFKNGVFPDISTSGTWSDVGHYSQMVWQGTTHVGCAIGSGSSWDILVCRYSPPGNYYGQKTLP